MDVAGKNNRLPGTRGGWGEGGGGGRAYRGDSCSNEELIKVAGRKTGKKPQLRTHSRSGPVGESRCNNTDPGGR